MRHAMNALSDANPGTAAPTVGLWFRPEMSPPDSLGNYSKSPTKPARFVEYLRGTPLWPHVTLRSDFAPVARDHLLLAHTPAYVDAFLTGAQPLCERNGLRWSPVFRESVLWTNGSLVAALDAAIDCPSQVQMAPVSGFHHAQPNGGSGFCTFSGQVVAALRLYRERGLRGVWFDLDGHFGNSIEDSRDFAPDLNEAIPPDANINPLGSHARYLADLQTRVEEVRTQLLAGQLDYVCFAHGADSHEWDQLGHQCSTAEWLEAARLIYAMLREVRQQRPVPVVLALFGGYRDDAPDAVLGLHAMDLALCLNLLLDVNVTYQAQVPPRP